MRIDRYVHEERLTWGATGVLLIVTTLHAAGILRLFVARPGEPPAKAAPIFQVSLLRLPPPPLPARSVDAPVPDGVDAERPKARQTRPVPILVDTPTSNPVPPDTQVKKYEIGDESLPGDPGPPMPPDAEPLYADAAPVEETPVVWDLKLVDMKPPIYPPRCLRLGIEGLVKVRALVGENGRPQEVTIGLSSGDAALDDSAMVAVRNWRFAPATRNGVPVRAWVIVPVQFKLID